MFQFFVPPPIKVNAVFFYFEIKLLFFIFIKTGFTGVFFKKKKVPIYWGKYFLKKKQKKTPPPPPNFFD